MDRNEVKRLVAPAAKKSSGRKVWSVDLEQVWLPFYTATNANGDTHLPHDALGAPVRLAYDADGNVKFSKSGKPATKVAKELAEAIRNTREQFVAGLVDYAVETAEKNPKAVKRELELARKAGRPIIDADARNLADASAARAKADVESAIGEDDEVPTPAPTPEPALVSA